MPTRTDFRLAFDDVADLYDRVRPAYPAALWDTYVRVAGLDEGDRIFEIGCGTGQATVDLARRGLAVVALEIGPALAARARERLASFPAVEVLIGDFDSIAPPGAPFAGIVAATAFHWLDPATRVPRCAAALARGGTLAVISAWHATERDELYPSARRAYARNTPPDVPTAQAVDVAAEAAATGLFEPATAREFPFVVQLDADAYIDLLDTFSGHRAMAPETRDALYAELRALIAQRGGRVERPYGCRLTLARRR